MDRDNKDRFPAVFCTGAAVDNEGFLQDERGAALPASLNSLMMSNCILLTIIINRSQSFSREDQQVHGLLLGQMQLRIQVLVLLLQRLAGELLFGQQVRQDVPLLGDSLHHLGNLEGFAHCHLQLVVVLPQFPLHLLQVVHFFLEAGDFGVALLLELE